LFLPQINTDNSCRSIQESNVSLIRGRSITPPFSIYEICSWQLIFNGLDFDKKKMLEIDQTNKQTNFGTSREVLFLRMLDQFGVLFIMVGSLPPGS